MGISSNPTSTNILQASKFLLSFDRLPDMTFFCTEAVLQGVSVGQAFQYTPNIDAPVPGDKMIYNPLTINFLIDEQMKSWTSILDWIKGYTFPETTDQYKNLGLQQKLQLGFVQPQYSDASLIVYSNKNNPILQVQFNRIFPINLTDIEFSTKKSADDIMTASASFMFTGYTITRN